MDSIIERVIRYFRKAEKKILVMAILLLISCLITYYFLLILRTTEAFTHFFYIPIVLAAVWWKKKGVLVAIFFAFILISGILILGMYGEILANSFRAISFVAISLIVAILSEKNEKLIKELEMRNVEMERFIYTVSHDLRSPLITIMGFADLVREDLNANEIERARNELEYIKSSAAKMDLLLTNTLQLSRIGRIINEPVYVPFGELVQEAQEQLAGQIRSSNVEISVAEDFPAVYVDRMRIVEVLVNLIENSINYMGEQPHPRIEIGYEEEDEKEVVIFVRDNGIGIEKSQHEKVFEIFYRVEKSMNSKRTGVGLAIVKRIIEVHKGRIWIESEEGKGCTVCFTLPVTPRSSAEAG